MVYHNTIDNVKNMVRLLIYVIKINILKYKDIFIIGFKGMLIY